MLNCTDLACVLHHHHFYAHLHHLKHHLQDDHDHHHGHHGHESHDHHHEAAAGEGSDVDNGNIQDLLNDTDSELSSLSHLDAPNDVLYMICGVVIAMVLVGLIIVLVAVTISKLRKREESSTVSPVTAGNVEAPPHHHHHHHHHQHHHPHSHHQLHHNGTSHPQQQQQQQNNSSSNHHHQQNGGSSPETGYSVPTPIAFRQSPSTVWVFPPLPPQPNIYNASSQDALVHNEKTGFKGLKRQLSGRFKRLVSRKAHEPAPVIPPELKPQLKTIYVY
ncbi:protein catecholamines up-like isoform X1 [Anopheles merus]|uniref:protein catecholamines up-like isoform X1 n=1 Tax=Anopheles merus TaxID=30066 RepID=UPI001BE458AE|nr:protein catecholamines up-like isoform X1 [Anopheles merus]XP_041760900.1 protein catecholamines up-like isoform X1 [Anopheles merus]XP_041760901.1 protein catecholamines up-like isoform X1 [Anopheles merus]XP_041760902.1 protein catecholamines up-like isoform X1 [Anopheles merus]XP_041760903.1 protein catecholamines up-like isoform X1 [Anopheles merus]